ncbi:MAG: DoxX family membrane protein [Pseudomonadota bacterium]
MALLADEQLPRNTVLTVTARTLFTSLFFLSGITHFTNIPYYQDLMPDNVPYSLFWILISGVVELAGAAMILFNWRARLGGWLLVAFLLPVTFVVHGYEMIYAETEIMRAMQQAHFLKGIALTGAALLITQLGASRQTAS